MRLYRASKKNKKIKKEMNELNKKSKNKNGTLNKKRNNEEINHLGYLINTLNKSLFEFEIEIFGRIFIQLQK